jgi:hypothetical protein
MKDELPAPDFDAQRYERPTQNWSCGNEANGNPCRIGPDSKGHCRATFECTPRLELKKGETKGRYVCTRTDGHGGACPCARGPLPDGTCSRSVPKCQPIRSLRSKRGVLTIWVVASTIAVLLLLLGGPMRSRFINPGALSTQHSGATFGHALEKLGMGASGNHQGCVACHQPAESGPQRWVSAAFGAAPGPFAMREFISDAAPEMSSLDRSCLRCHTHHQFHQPNLVRDHSCSVCHEEHNGAGPMHAPGSSTCNSCHASATVMETAFQKAKSLDPGAFDYRSNGGLVQFNPPRPARGYTKVFHSFATDHPEFQVRAENLKDPNTLKFNHQRHLADDIPLIRGKKLQCATCHEPDASGIYHLKISYARHCQSCHSLQFDVQNPQLLIPHGSSEAVRSFLQSLPTQYAEYGTRVKGITGKVELEEFVRQNLGQVREQILSGDNLETKVFFSTKRSSPGPKVGDLQGGEKPLFYGCAYCHEVKPAAFSAPAITPPVIPDRWQHRASFDHSKHATVNCASCHDVTQSRETSDILLPSKANCVECHSPKGGVANDCFVCHTYHNALAPNISEYLRPRQSSPTARRAHDPPATK